MKILQKNLKQGSITLQTQQADDVWQIYRVVQEGDKIFGWTERKVKIGDGLTQKASAAATKRMQLTITVEKSSYETDGRNVRLLGPIVEGNDYVAAGEYHSFTIDEKTEITIIKDEWPAYALRQLEEAAAGSKGSAIIVAFDRSQATLGTISSQGFRKLATIEGAVQKKGLDAPAKANFYADIVAQVAQLDERVQSSTIVLASSNFWRDPLILQFEESAKDLRKKVKWIECDEITDQAINQLSKTPEFQQMTLEKSQADVYNAFEEALRRLATDGAATYGLEQVKKAAEAGAVATVLVSQELMKKSRENETFARLEEILKTIEQSSGVVHIVGLEFTIQSKLDGLTGIIALLRYKIE